MSGETFNITPAAQSRSQSVKCLNMLLQLKRQSSEKEANVT